MKAGEDVNKYEDRSIARSAYQVFFEIKPIRTSCVGFCAESVYQAIHGSQVQTHQ